MIKFISHSNDKNINKYYKKENPKRHETILFQLNNDFQKEISKPLVKINYSNKQNITIITK